MPGASAPLSDPNATSNLKFQEPVDAALRHVVHALLQVSLPTYANVISILVDAKRDAVSICHIS
jgi:hypothetical protein